MKLKTVFAIVAASVPFAAGTSSAQDKQATPEKSASTQSAGKNESGRDAKRMKELMQANMAEVEAGKLALEKAQDPKVKEFAQHMIEDHTKMLQEVQSLAQSKGVELPGAPDAKHQKGMKKLESASGANFDREYVRAMVRDHRDALKLARRTAKSAQDGELKSSAEKAAPEIQDHLKMAQDLSKSGKRSASGKTGAASGGSQAGAAR
jgi:putative membrane protein